MQRLTNGTWVVIADGEKALFLENEGDGRYPLLRLRRQENNDNPPDRDQGSDKAGQAGNARGGTGSAMEETDFHQLEKERFAQDLAERLYKLSHAGKFARLVLVASPQMLGIIRPALHKEVQDKIVLEIAKSLTSLPVDQIEKAIVAELSGA
ncbi:host attachment family protein [Falsirhodobacter halotolerans]|uniref:host attachment family protein n=1 Tax=Falsirhodobacter halotolerans TaxID=1146892 RepID=UPI001FD143DD|nr:host attachment family protein [Falsirhodobacter halotolerans]MCJ8139659.1 host attachment family protein [Falsirhodobacter halotolerans]